MQEILEDNDNAHAKAICSMLTSECRKQLARALAIVHMGGETCSITKDALMSPLIAIDNDLKSIQSWLSIADGDSHVGAMSSQDGLMKAQGGLMEGDCETALYSDPKIHQTDQHRQSRPSIVVHPPPSWDENRESR